MITTHSHDGIWTVTLNRPDKANALNADMLQALCDAVDQACAAQARALILTGTGRVFSAGADLDAARAGLATSPLWEALSARIAQAPFLTVAALNGTVAGGATGMVLACDLRLSVEGARMFYPVMRLGFLPQPSDPRRLAALIGPARTKLILMAGYKASAAEARDWGLIDLICAPDDLIATALDLAKDACSASADHCAAIKQMVPDFV